MESQNKQLKKHFNKGGSITGLEALMKYGIGHLPRRILDLKEKGYPIESKFITVKKANGKTARVKQYKKIK
jgi:hypothetical protein